MNNPDSITYNIGPMLVQSTSSLANNVDSTQGLNGICPHSQRWPNVYHAKQCFNAGPTYDICPTVFGHNGRVTWVPHTPKHEKQMSFSAWKTNDVDKGENNTHKQRKLPNAERSVKGSNGHNTHFWRISTDAKTWHSCRIGQRMRNERRLTI